MHVAGIGKQGGSVTVGRFQANVRGAPTPASRHVVGTDYCTIALREHVAPSANSLRLDVERRARIVLNTRFITLEIA